MGKFKIALLSLLSLAFVAFLIWAFMPKKSEFHIIKIAASSVGSESHLFIAALAQVVNSAQDEIIIDVRDTKGSKDSLNQLEEGYVELAAIQADTKTSSDIKVVANLYPDFYQLIVRRDSNITFFGDLEGKKMALPNRQSGQWESFWFVADHYGISLKDIINVPHFKKDIIEGLKNGDIDAIFSVRAPMNSMVENILDSGYATLLPIEQGEAISLKQPSLVIKKIPKGTYGGSPTIPKDDISTISVNRILVTTDKVSESDIRYITSVLFERRSELLKFTPLAGLVSMPDRKEGVSLPPHEGAQNFYDRDKPSYYEENADFLGLVLTIFLMIGSAAMGIQKFLMRNQKNLADKYTLELTNVMKRVNQSENLLQLNEHKKHVEDMLHEIIVELDRDNVTVEGFQFFSFTWDKVYNIILEKQRILISASNGV